jgi:Tol biopolymer transport system component
MNHMTRYDQITRLLLVAFMLALPAALPAQQTQHPELTRDGFPGDRQAYTEARQLLREGNRLYDAGWARRVEALQPYLQAHALIPGHPWLNARIGEIYLGQKEPSKALDYLRQAGSLEEAPPVTFYLLGQAMALQHEPGAAIDYFNQYRRMLSPEEVRDPLAEIEKRILECQHALVLMHEPVRVRVERLGGDINSPYDDYNAVPGPDGTPLYFTSRRPLDDDARRDRQDHRFYENIFVAEATSEPSGRVSPLERPLNTRSHSAAVAMDPEGQWLVTYQGIQGGDLYLSEREGTGWSRPRPVRRINSRHQNTHAAITSDGNTLYFISDRPGGYGGRDIWTSSRDRRGRWAEPVNLGPVVNTEYDEEGLFLGPDDRTLYFSSRGHNSMGGFDVFVTQFEGGSWSAPQNLGYPINTAFDELFFSLTENGRAAYISTRRPGDEGVWNIYRIRIMEP